MTQFGIQNQFPLPLTREGWQKGKKGKKKAPYILNKAFQPQSCFL